MGFLCLALQYISELSWVSYSECPIHFTFGIISEVNLFCYWLFTLSNLPLIASSKEPSQFLSSLLTVWYYIILCLFWSMNEPSLWIPMLSLTSGAKVTSDDTQHQTQCLQAMAKHPVVQLSGASRAVSPCSCARSHRAVGVSAQEGWGRPGSGGCSGCSSSQVRWGGGMSRWALCPGPGVGAKPSTRKVSLFLWSSGGCGHPRQISHTGFLHPNLKESEHIGPEDRTKGGGLGKQQDACAFWCYQGHAKPWVGN